MTPMEIQYGKTRVIFFRLAKRSAPPFAASVTIDVFGERFGAAYTEGDNREVVATLRRQLARRIRPVPRQAPASDVPADGAYPRLCA